MSDTITSENINKYSRIMRYDERYDSASARELFKLSSAVSYRYDL